MIMIKYRRVNIMMYIMYVASTKVYFILSLGANGILDLSNKNSPHKDLLGSNAFNILQEIYPPPSYPLTSLKILLMSVTLKR